MSKVAKDKVVEIHYTLRLADGSVEDSTEGEPPLPYLHGANNIVPGLEAALEGRDVGESFTITLAPADAYGEYDEELTDELPLDAFPEEAELNEGDEIFLVGEDGVEVPGVIERIDEDTLYVDYNHPLAGETLSFEVEVVAVRDATPEELEHGHAHDPYSEEEDDEEWEEDEDDEEWEEDEWVEMDDSNGDENGQSG